MYGYLKKAEVNLVLARYCLENGYYDASANRSYYAAFQAAIAALAVVGIATSKPEHKWTQSTFNGELIKRRKIYPNRLSSYLVDMIEVRIRADYSDEPISKKTASRQFSKAEDFVTSVAMELQK